MVFYQNAAHLKAFCLQLLFKNKISNMASTVFYTLLQSGPKTPYYS